jgi:hypothetical protein
MGQVIAETVGYSEAVRRLVTIRWLAKLVGGFPAIKPIKVSADGRSRLCCCFCLEEFGLRGSELETSAFCFDDKASFAEHMRSAHQRRRFTDAADAPPAPEPPPAREPGQWKPIPHKAAKGRR